MSNIIKLENVTKSYRKGWFGQTFNAIENISFSVATGESVGFIGHNGAGKSSTIRIIMGLQTPSSGTVMLQGMSPRLPESRKQIAYVPESPLLYDHLTPLELLKLCCTSHKVEPSAIRKQSEEWLARLGLDHVANKTIRQFSKGMVQRTALAMGLVVEPKFLILDEPLSGLDPTGRREVVEILSEYRHKGGGLLFSSHVLTDVEVLADNFLFIHKGQIRLSGSPGALLDKAGESYEVIIETRQSAPVGYERLYGDQFRSEVSAADLQSHISQLNTLNGTRLIAIRSRNTLESAYFRFVESMASNDSPMQTKAS